LFTEALAFASNIDACIVTVDGGAARAVADHVIPHLRPRTLYADWTTKSTAVRDGIAALCEKAELPFADVAIVDTVAWVDRRVALFASGPGAEALAALVRDTRIDVMVIDVDLPVSAEIKLLRSGFTKGLEALLVETMVAAHELDVADHVAGSIHRFMEADFPRVADLLVGSALRHATRRAEEMVTVREFLAEALGGAPMARATADVLRGIAELSEAHVADLPQDSTGVIDLIAGMKLFARLSVETGPTTGS
jgi:3-hydroxyisobutyrate dehydrogenase